MPFSNAILAGETLVRDSIQSEGFTAGAIGWMIARDGSAEFNNIVSRGKLIVGPEDSQHIEITLDPIFPFRPSIFFYTGANESAPGSIISSDPAADQLALIINAPAATGALGGAQIFMATQAGFPGRMDLSASELFLNADSSILFGVPAKYELAWSNIPLVNSWADIAGARANYFKDAAGEVHLRGQISAGTSGTIATLPAGYRPTQSLEFLMRGVGGVILCAVLVANTGVITVTANLATAQASGIRLDAIRFPTL